MTRDQLAQRIVETSVLRGTFTLRSGRTSDYYIDKYLFSTEPDVLAALGEAIAERIPAGVTRLAGAELGGIPLVSAASISSGKPCVFIRNARKDYGTAKQLEGRLQPEDRVLVVEDVCTSGGQVLEAVGVIESAGARVAGIIATIDREEGARDAIESAGYPFEALFTKTDLGL